MKTYRLNILIILLILFSTGLSISGHTQTVITRTFGANTVNDPRLMVSKNLFTPRYIDTTAANLDLGIDSCGAVIYTYSTNSMWIRACSPKHWTKVGLTSLAAGVGITKGGVDTVHLGGDISGIVNFNIRNTYSPGTPYTYIRLNNRMTGDSMAGKGVFTQTPILKNEPATVTDPTYSPSMLSINRVISEEFNDTAQVLQYGGAISMYLRRVTDSTGSQYGAYPSAGKFLGLTDPGISIVNQLMPPRDTTVAAAWQDGVTQASIHSIFGFGGSWGFKLHVLNSGFEFPITAAVAGTMDLQRENSRGRVARLTGSGIANFTSNYRGWQQGMNGSSSTAGHYYSKITGFADLGNTDYNIGGALSKSQILAIETIDTATSFLSNPVWRALNSIKNGYSMRAMGDSDVLYSQGYVYLGPQLPTHDNGLWPQYRFNLIGDGKWTGVLYGFNSGRIFGQSTQATYAVPTNLFIMPPAGDTTGGIFVGSGFGQGAALKTVGKYSSDAVAGGIDFRSDYQYNVDAGPRFVYTSGGTAIEKRFLFSRRKLYVDVIDTVVMNSPIYKFMTTNNATWRIQNEINIIDSMKTMIWAKNNSYDTILHAGTSQYSDGFNVMRVNSSDGIRVYARNFSSVNMGTTLGVGTGFTGGIIQINSAPFWAYQTPIIFNRVFPSVDTDPAHARSFKITNDTTTTGPYPTFDSTTLYPLEIFYRNRFNNEENVKFSIRGDGHTTIASLKTGVTAPTTSGTTKMVITDQNGLLSFADIPGGGSGITSINSLVNVSQSLVTGTSGLDFNINSAVSTHTFNLPTASATKRGALDSTDWVTFNNKQAALVDGSGTTISGNQVNLGGTVSSTVSLDDVSSGSTLFDIGRNTNFSRFSAYANNVEITGNTDIILTGAVKIGGHTIPTVDAVYDIGDATHQFRDLYLSGASLYMNTIKVLSNRGIRLLSNAGDITTPVDGEVWYNSSTGKFRARQNGITSDVIGGGITGLTVGTTTITSGVSGNILYNNAGVLGERTITGSGPNVVLSTSPTFITSIFTPLIIGGTATTSDLFLQTTSGVGTTGADMHFLVGNNGATEAMTVLNNGNVGIGNTNPGAKLDLGTTGAAILPSIQTLATGVNGNFITGTGGGSTSTTSSPFLLAGATNMAFKVGVNGNVASTLTASHSYATFEVASSVITEAGSGTHALLASAAFNPLTITGGVATVTTGATVYIQDATIASGANNYSLLVNAGTSRFQGNVEANNPASTSTVLNVGGGINPSVGSNGFVTTLGGGITEAGSGTHGILAGAAILTPIVTSGAASVTNATGLYVSSDANASGANNSAIWAVGTLRLGLAGTIGGVIKIEGATSGVASIVAPAVAGTPTLTLPTITGTIVQYAEGNTASSSTPTPTGDARENFYDVTALAVNPTFGVPSGTAINHNTLTIRIKDNGTSRTLAWNAIYRGGVDIALPTATTISLTMYVQFLYNSADAKWDLVGLTNGL